MQYAKREKKEIRKRRRLVKCKNSSNLSIWWKKVATGFKNNFHKEFRLVEKVQFRVETITTKGTRGREKERERKRERKKERKREREKERWREEKPMMKSVKKWKNVDTTNTVSDSSILIRRFRCDACLINLMRIDR